MWTLYGLAEVGSLTGSIVRRWKSRAGDDRNGAEAADTDLLVRRMSALGVDADSFARLEPALFGNLKNLCGDCEHQDRCRHDPPGVAWEEEYCPNAVVLNAVAELRWFRRANKPGARR